MIVAEGKLPAIELLDALSGQLKRLAPHLDLEDPGQREQLTNGLPPPHAPRSVSAGA